MKTMIRTFMNIAKVLTNLHFSPLAATRLNVANCRPPPSTLSLLLNFFTITTTIILHFVMLVIDAGDGKLVMVSLVIDVIRVLIKTVQSTD